MEQGGPGSAAPLQQTCLPVIQPGTKEEATCTHSPCPSGQMSSQPCARDSCKSQSQLPARKPRNPLQRQGVWQLLFNKNTSWQTAQVHIRQIGPQISPTDKPSLTTGSQAVMSPHQERQITLVAPKGPSMLLRQLKSAKLVVLCAYNAGKGWVKAGGFVSRASHVQKANGS